MKAIQKTAVILLLSSLVIFSAANLSRSDDKPASTDRETALLKLVLGYTNWSKANDQAVLMASQIAQLCTSPSRSFMRAHTQDPHSPKFIMVFVNEIGRKEFLGKKLPKFAEGTVIVKEKHSPIASAAPELLTVMIKRPEGFDPQNGNWEYATFNGPATKVLSNGKLEKCQDCHEMQRKNDFVFRDYLSNWSRLK